MTGYDAQPINGTYPTSLWQPGEIIVEDINLKLPAQIAEGEYHLVTGLYDLSTGQRLVAVDNQGQPIPDNMVILANTRVSSGKLTLTVKTPEGTIRQMTIVGLAHDLNAQMYVFDGVAIGYTTVDTLKWLGQPQDYNEIHILVSENSNVLAYE